MRVVGDIQSTGYWSKAVLSDSRHDHIKSHARINYPKFYASYEIKNTPCNMHDLLGHTYGKIWLKERGDCLMKEKKKMAIKHDPMIAIRRIAAARKEKINNQKKPFDFRTHYVPIDKERILTKRNLNCKVH